MDEEFSLRRLKLKRLPSNGEQIGEENQIDLEVFIGVIAKRFRGFLQREDLLAVK